MRITSRAQERARGQIAGSCRQGARGAARGLGSQLGEELGPAPARRELELPVPQFCASKVALEYRPRCVRGWHQMRLRAHLCLRIQSCACASVALESLGLVLIESD